MCSPIVENQIREIKKKIHDDYNKVDETFRVGVEIEAPVKQQRRSCHGRAINRCTPRNKLCN